jgi:hypothetical protein
MVVAAGTRLLTLRLVTTEARMVQNAEIKKLQSYWRDESEAAAVYDRLSQAARDDGTRLLLLEMRDAERRHALRWGGRIRELGGELPAPPSPWKARWLSLLSRFVGQQRVFAQPEIAERQAVAGYGAGLDDEVSARLAAEMQADEHQHAIDLRAMTRSAPSGLLPWRRWV